MDTVQFLQTLDLRHNSPMPGSMLILTWVGIIFVKISNMANAFRFFPTRGVATVRHFRHMPTQTFSPKIVYWWKMTNNALHILIMSVLCLLYFLGYISVLIFYCLEWRKVSLSPWPSFFVHLFHISFTVALI
jgi:hypothetical protein